MRSWGSTVDELRRAARMAACTLARHAVGGAACTDPLFSVAAFFLQGIQFSGASPDESDEAYNRVLNLVSADMPVGQVAQLSRKNGARWLAALFAASFTMASKAAPGKPSHLSSIGLQCICRKSIIHEEHSVAQLETSRRSRPAVAR